MHCGIDSTQEERFRRSLPLGSVTLPSPCGRSHNRPQLQYSPFPVPQIVKAYVFERFILPFGGSEEACGIVIPQSSLQIGSASILIGRKPADLNLSPKLLIMMKLRHSEFL